MHGQLDVTKARGTSQRNLTHRGSWTRACRISKEVTLNSFLLGQEEGHVQGCSLDSMLWKWLWQICFIASSGSYLMEWNQVSLIWMMCLVSLLLELFSLLLYLVIDSILLFDLFSSWLCRLFHDFSAKNNVIGVSNFNMLELLNKYHYVANRIYQIWFIIIFYRKG